MATSARFPLAIQQLVQIAPASHPPALRDATAGIETPLGKLVRKRGDEGLIFRCATTEAKAVDLVTIQVDLAAGASHLSGTVVCPRTARAIRL